MATRYILMGDIMYKKFFSKLHYDPYLRCLVPDEAKKVMQEIHDDDYENHVEGRSLAHKAINQGYYWPKMFNDAEYVKKCPQSKVRSFLNHAKRGPPHIIEPLALHSMRDGRSGPTSSSTTSVQVPIGCNQLFHKVNQSCASSKS